jgi:hypothetical protein
VSEKGRVPWKPILIIVAAGFVLSLSSCFGLFLGPRGAWERLLSGAAMGGAIIFGFGLVVLVIALVMELVLRFWRGKS